MLLRMDFVLIPMVSAAVAAITLISGFGLGTVLMPVFALFFPIEIAIAATGVVHFMNNLFKLALVGKHAGRDVVLRFGIPAVIAACVGAGLMAMLTDVPPIARYRVAGVHAEITTLKLTTALLLAVFAGLELWPKYQTLSFPPNALPIGGMLSGFFGGVCGMQGALRAPFLLRAGLSKDAYVGTANVISTIVDCARLVVYALGLAWLSQNRDYSVLTEARTIWLVAAACLSGFAGAYVGKRYLQRFTLRGIRVLVSVMLFALALVMGAGLLH